MELNLKFFINKILSFCCPYKSGSYFITKAWDIPSIEVRGTGIPTSQIEIAHAYREHPTIYFCDVFKLPVFGHQSKSERFILLYF